LNSGGCKTKKPARVCLAVSLVYHEGVVKLTSLPFTVKGNRRQKTKRSSCSGTLHREMLSVTTVIEAPKMVVEDIRGGSMAVLITTKSEAEDDNGEENLIPEQEEFPKVDQNEVFGGSNNIKRESSPPPTMINSSPSRVRVSSFVPVVSSLRRETVVSENTFTPPRSNNNPHIRTIPQYINPILVQPNNNLQPTPDYYDNYMTGPPLRPTFSPNDYFIPPDEESDPGVIIFNGRTSNYNESTDENNNNLVDVNGMYVDPRWVRMKQEENINHYDVHQAHTYPDNEVYFPNKRMRIHQSGNNNSTPHQ